MVALKFAFFVPCTQVNKVVIAEWDRGGLDNARLNDSWILRTVIVVGLFLILAAATNNRMREKIDGRCPGNSTF